MINSLKFLPKDFTTLRTPFTIFALNLLFQDTSYSLALKYSSFLFKFFSFAFYNINFWFKISKICPKISHFSQISYSRGTLVGRIILLNCTKQANYQNQIMANFEQISQECGNVSLRILLLQQLETFHSESSYG